MNNKNLYEKLQTELEGKEGLELVEFIAHNYGDKTALMSAFNPEDVIISFWLKDLKNNLATYFLDTKKHFPETLQYVKRVSEKYNISNLIYLEPKEDLIANIDKDGKLWQTQVNRCCWLRKVEPISRVFKEKKFDIIFTGRRAEQNNVRGSKMEFVEYDEENDVVKLNPLKNWTSIFRDEFMEDNKIEHHPLYHLGYLSISCAPCTTPVFKGEDERAGRWRHTRLNQTDSDGGKTECGLHS